ncbi:MAG: 4'-phosphopantetheinyl transferase superfamily protein [Longimicrobiales bacterium]|nr:4'-phosphopantetheinyl transferase superfamily protein [Longimicrobiales bacterium]
MKRGDAPAGAEPEAVRRALEELLEPGVSIAVWGVDVTALDVLPEEAETVTRAVERRRVEFARGRSCARAALTAAGGPAVAIPVGEQRQPVFPSGFVGSITHCQGLVAAAVGRASSGQGGGIGGPTGEGATNAGLAGLGIDAEEARRVTPDILDMVLTEFERRGSSRAATPLDDDAGCVTFSAKEAVFKAVFPLTGEWLGFKAVGLEVSGSTFAVAWTADSVGRATSERLGRLEGRWRRVGGLILTACWVPDGD